MKPRNTVLLSLQLPGRHKIQNIQAVSALYTVVYDGQLIAIAVIDQNIATSIAPRYTNNFYSQKKSAQNAADKLNAMHNTDLFSVKQVTL